MSSTDGFAGTAPLISAFDALRGGDDSRARFESSSFLSCLYCARVAFCCRWRAAPCYGDSTKEKREQRAGATAEKKGRETWECNSLEIVFFSTFL